MKRIIEIQLLENDIVMKDGIIDDNEDILDVLKLILEKFVANNLNRGFKIARKEIEDNDYEAYMFLFGIDDKRKAKLQIK